MTETALVRFDDDEPLGPAMRALNPRQRSFVESLLTGANPTQAARVAGYGGDNPNSVRVAAHRLAHDAKIQAALHEEGIKLLRVNGVLAISVLAAIAQSPVSDDRDRISAAKELLSRSFPATTAHAVTVTHRTESEIDHELRAVLGALGIDEKTRERLITGKVIDAEFTHVSTPEAPSEPGEPDEWAEWYAEPAPEPTPSIPLAKEAGTASDFDPTATGGPENV